MKRLCTLVGFVFLISSCGEVEDTKIDANNRSDSGVAPLMYCGESGAGFHDLFDDEVTDLELWERTLISPDPSEKFLQETNGQLVMTLNVAEQETRTTLGYSSKRNWNALGSTITLDLTAVPDSNESRIQTRLQLTTLVPNHNLRIQIQGGSMRLFLKFPNDDGAAEPFEEFFLGQTSFSSDIHKSLRLVFGSDRVDAEFSADRTEWTTFATYNFLEGQIDPYRNANIDLQGLVFPFNPPPDEPTLEPVEHTLSFDAFELCQ